MRSIDRKTKGMALLLVTFAAIASGILLLAQATNVATTAIDAQSNNDVQLAVVTTASDTSAMADSTNDDAATITPGWGEGMIGIGRHFRSFGRKMGGFGGIEVSDEYKTAVTTILEADTDVQQLLEDGYNVTRIMPLIKSVVDAEGNIATKATRATVVLTKDTGGVAFVSVDLGVDKVTQIVIHTKTVIKK